MTWKERSISYYLYDAFDRNNQTSMTHNRTNHTILKGLYPKMSTRFLIGVWNCSDNVVFFVFFHFAIWKWYTNKIRQTMKKTICWKQSMPTYTTLVHYYSLQVLSFVGSLVFLTFPLVIILSVLRRSTVCNFNSNYSQRYPLRLHEGLSNVKPHDDYHPR
jgi:hypothetical protein